MLVVFCVQHTHTFFSGNKMFSLIKKQLYFELLANERTKCSRNNQKWRRSARNSIVSICNQQRKPFLCVLFSPDRVYFILIYFFFARAHLACNTFRSASGSFINVCTQTIKTFQMNKSNLPCVFKHSHNLVRFI